MQQLQTVPLTQVVVNGKRLKLDQKRLLGVGGEAMVFRERIQGADRAVKVYLAPTPERSRKLNDMLPCVSNLPAAVVAPQQLALDPASGQAVGFTMRLLDSGYTEVRMLANRAYRASSSLTSRDVALLFTDAHRTLSALHRAGLVVGDLNDLNLMFRGADMLFIDVDSFQFGAYPCLVATEAFLDPTLYGYDLAQQPYFAPDNDWYSFAVLLFKSLLLTHPYGGVHPRLPLLTARAAQRVSVLDSSVQYPKIAQRPEVLSDDLLHEFDRWFERGERGVFPEALLHDYAASLVACPACGATYPGNRPQCPVCAAVTLVLVPARGPQMTGAVPLIRTPGRIIHWGAQGQIVAAIAYENGKAVLYISAGQAPVRRLELFEALPQAAYAFLGENLDRLVVSSSPESDELMIVDVSGLQPVGVLKTTTGSFGPRERMFGVGAGGRALYRLAGGFLMRGEVQDQYGSPQLVERPVLSIAEDQTWLRVAPDSDRVFGFFRALNVYQHWLLVDRTQVEAQIPALDAAEVLVEADAKFGARSVLFVRRAQLNGVDRVRVDEIDQRGRLLTSQILTQTDDYDPIDAHAYAAGLVLHATDDGVVQERLETRQRKAFSQTEPFVRRGDALLPFGNGLLVAREQAILHLTL